MIISKPHFRAQFAIGVFLILCFALSYYGFDALLSGEGNWIHLVIVFLVFPIALIIFIRQLINFKLITAGEKRMRVAHPFLFRGYEFKLSDISEWQEEIIKTRNDPYRKLTVRTEKHILTLTHQENTNYLKILDYLTKKVPKVRKKLK